MGNILSALKETAFFLLGKPETPLETILSAAIPLVVGVIVLGKLGRAMDAKEESALRSIIVMAVGVAVVVIGVTVSNLYIAPAVNPALGKWMWLIAAVVLSLAITAPVCLLVLKQTYVSAAITTVLMAAIVAALIYLTAFAYEQITGAGKAGSDIDKRTEEMEQVMGGE